ncbi:nitrate- and nitrite sensing domain-containing protein [Marinobacterium aestuariivivens]|uniref:Nitrate- and nitrite sensing domain-containing protein n=1 Tax=Marinobacterium aestuariivivens TaxID=1698799 RepID=A0ABW2A6E3_9GAMM
MQTAEWAGQARALGTGIAASGRSCPEQRVRLRFLHQKIRQLSETAFQALQQNPGAETPGFRLPQCQQAVQTFLQCLEQELLDQERPQIDARHYFQQATRAVDELLALVDAALDQLRRIHGEG